MRKPGWFGVALAVWFVGELVALAIIVRALGWGGALLIGALTSVAGVVMLRRIGVGAARGLRRAFNGEPASEGAMLDGSLAALGSVLLILPGFLSDLAGLALAAPSVRQWLAGRFGAVAAQAARPPGTIELSTSDWRRIEDDPPTRKPELSRRG